VGLPRGRVIQAFDLGMSPDDTCADARSGNDVMEYSPAWMKKKPRGVGAKLWRSRNRQAAWEDLFSVSSVSALSQSYYIVAILPGRALRRAS